MGSILYVEYKVVVILDLIGVVIEFQGKFDSNDNEKRALSSFDTLAGIGLGKRAQLSSIDSLAGLGLGKRALSSFDTLGGIGLGKRSFIIAKRSVSSFDTLGGKLSECQPLY
ncbi:hypothetical protein ANCCAN_22043 [Ancylostoma caninum]|uniref:Uncharacterized protein n=1 Tax=Ancylostoma caninum TaxID=29170 RepID=A0A368FJ16_ANCCA|nr:hypothetical protein ANCCAN_22043 [Ancylostoma caninum]